MERCWYRALVIFAAAGGIMVLLFLGGNSSAEQNVNVPYETQSSDISAPIAQVSFPYVLSENGLVVEGTVSYSGTYMEDGSGDVVADITGLMVYNPQQRMVRFGAIALEQNGQQLYFFVYCLPPGERCLILEKNRHTYTQETVTQCRELRMRWEYQDMHEEQVHYVGFGEQLTVVNCGAKQLRHVTLWYKQYDREQECYLGGVAYSAHVFRLQPQEQRVLTPQTYCAGGAKIVAVELE